MVDEGFLYVCDYQKHEVRRYRVGDTTGTVVTGGNGRGGRLSQLYNPAYVFVDRNHSIYVWDNTHHRVMEWVKGAKEGIVLAGGRCEGNLLTQLSYHRGVFVDPLGTVYVVEAGNHRVMRWCNEATQGNVIIGGNGEGQQANQLSRLWGLYMAISMSPIVGMIELMLCVLKILNDVELEIRCGDVADEETCSTLLF
ncbi:unnamed protein product [Didymodactylos carnosus]|uniref:NHL repeat protein n=1 Tax=Didymodactylos carnosus TaxID=1234261 RepID=A0A8S2FNI4_9BILA|nr:unnamed protein product [Didymodactylos carnosus]CAF4293811.1 unnamed protein product [Didymodactylos carnosus]